MAGSSFGLPVSGVSYGAAYTRQESPRALGDSLVCADLQEIFDSLKAAAQDAGQSIDQE